MLKAATRNFRTKIRVTHTKTLHYNLSDKILQLAIL